MSVISKKIINAGIGHIHSEKLKINKKFLFFICAHLPNSNS